MNNCNMNQENNYASIENVPVLPLVFDSVACKVPESLAKSFMTCPLCKDFLKKVTTVTVCLHRFCESCIKKYLKVISMKCPVCGIRLSSLRQLRTDVEYGRLVEELQKGLPAQRKDMELTRAQEQNIHIKTETSNSEEPHETTSKSII
ncbi:hypothetical protein GpartN1_g7026.t1 [Galdieria partita]|uniref:RING-type E3 ubiquitin transferase n=1 Tax=Galdieria partita TaxID=83374 RepID=A0A9C7UU50_9RHOD|nr:hypothetical protein GpartN1_g7026.t1 [Galdieria partita]